MRGELNPSGETFLHCFDPRLKLLLLLLLMWMIFSARSFVSLLPVVSLLIAILWWRPAIFMRLKRHLYFLRWLLLFTFLLHLMLTPGRTLFGVRFLSYDGLLRGLMVDTQLLLALFFTLVLTLFTAHEAVAWATANLIRPLGRLGLPVSEAGGLLLLVLHFLPQVYRQGAPFFEKRDALRRGGLAQRLQHLSVLVGDAVLALVEQADSLARDIVRGQNPLKVVGDDYVWCLRDSLCLLSGLLLTLLCWSL